MIKIIKEVSKDELYDFLYDVDIHDPKLYEEINSLNYINIFQFSGATAEKIVKDIHPDNFEELAIVNAAARPGTIDFVPEYIQAKTQGVKKYPDPVHDILKETKGVVFYQEQIMILFNKVGGFTLEETNTVRGLMKKLAKADKKKEDMDKWEACVKRFISGAIKNGVQKQEAERIADDLLKLSQYSFNKSHSVAYTYNAIMTLYLTVYFRIYYYAATLTYLNQNKKDEIFDAISKMKQRNINVLPPDINTSNKEFTPINDKEIRFGLVDIKFVGEVPAEFIIKNRPYKSFFDFIVKAIKPKSGINERVLRGLISTGCFDEFEPNRKKLIFILDEFLERKKSTKVEEKLLSIYQTVEREAEVLNFKTTQLDYIDYEKEFFDYNFFHGYFTDALKEKLYEAQKKGIADLGFGELVTANTTKRIPVVLNSLRLHIDKNGNEMAFVVFEDMYGTKQNVPIFASLFKFLKEILKVNSVYLIYFYLTDNGKIMFGKPGWIETEAQKKTLAKELLLKE